MLTVSQIAKELNVSTSTIYRLIKDGSLRAIKLGDTCWRVGEDAFNKFLDDRRQ